MIVVEIAALAFVNRDDGYAAGDTLIQDVAHAVQFAAAFGLVSTGAGASLGRWPSR